MKLYFKDTEIGEIRDVFVETLDVWNNTFK